MNPLSSGNEIKLFHFQANKNSQKKENKLHVWYRYALELYELYLKSSYFGLTHNTGAYKDLMNETFWREVLFNLLLNEISIG